MDRTDKGTKPKPELSRLHSPLPDAAG